MQRKFTFTEGEYYHIYTRGIDKRQTFLTDYDYRRFQLLLMLANSMEPFTMRNVEQFIRGESSATSTEVARDPASPRRAPALRSGPSPDLTSATSAGTSATNKGIHRAYEHFIPTERRTGIVAYALMPNHFHLIAKETSLKGISQFMHKLLTGYTMYFNTKHDRTGGLFTGPFKAKHIDNDDYLRWVFSYVHLNPLSLHDPKWEENVAEQKGVGNLLREYSHSSFHDYYIEDRPETAILSKELFPDLAQVETVQDLAKTFANRI